MKDTLELRRKTKTIPPVKNINVTDVGKRGMNHRNAILKINIVETLEKRI
jgi:hypothetical protein